MKKAYQKPEIRKVKLVPSEAVLQACKTFGSSGPLSVGCQMSSSANFCSGIGS